MLRKYFSIVGPILRVNDILILVFTWFFSYYLRKEYPLEIMTNAIPPFSEYMSYLVVIGLLWMTVFSSFGLYSNKRLMRRTVESLKVLRAHGLSLLIFIALTYLLSNYKLSRGVFVYFGFLSSALFVGSRLVFRNTLRRLRSKGYNKQKVIIAGSGAAAQNVFDRLNRHPELGMDILGFLGTTKASNVLGSFSETLSILKKTKAHKLILALSRNEYPAMDEILKDLKDEVIDIVFIPDIHEYVVLGCEVEEFDGLPLVSLNETPMQGTGLIAKRMMDFLLTSIALVLFSPLMTLLALIVKSTSKGPIFYVQERMSVGGKPFGMLKFRSMSVDQKGDTEVLTKKDDPRVTAIGKLMRKTSLDELPQLFNVLLGDMSLVGPRPERSWVVHELRTKIPSYMLKHKVKAGITGWAQVNGWRGDTSLEKRIHFDLYYIRHWSILLDIKILFLTVFKGFINRNAY